MRSMARSIIQCGVRMCGGDDHLFASVTAFQHRAWHREVDCGTGGHQACVSHGRCEPYLFFCQVTEGEGSAGAVFQLLPARHRKMACKAEEWELSELTAQGMVR